MRHPRSLIIALMFVVSIAPPSLADDSPLPGTKPLTMRGDIAAQLVEGVDRFLLKKTEESVAKRAKYWNRDVSSPEAYNKSVEPNRKRLAHILGVRDARVPFEAPEFVANTSRGEHVGSGDGFDAFAIRWPAFGDVYGEGLLLLPKGKPIVADVVAIPDADQTPEQITGLVAGVPPESQFARRLAESGCRVVVPVLIDRTVAQRGGRSKLTTREYLYRPSFVLGRHLIGYEIQKVLAVVDWFAKDANERGPKIGVIGWGDGAMLAFYAGALDTRIDAVSISGYFGPREGLWKEPLDHNVFGLLNEFGDAEITSLIAPRHLFIEENVAPNVVVARGDGGGRLVLFGGVGGALTHALADSGARFVLVVLVVLVVDQAQIDHGPLEES